MHRKDRILAALRSLCTQRPAQSSVLRRHSGFSAEDVAEVAKVDRTNASRDLNLLAQEGIIERIAGRPVLFTLKTVPSIPETRPNGQHKASDISFTEPLNTKVEPEGAIAVSAAPSPITRGFETLIGGNDGLKVAIQQAKAAILYPPRGLHTLLSGPSGVGKTTLARLMHAFALELGTLPSDAPFVSFNCADYAGNPQLLMAHLFGVVRGAYTGAERDREGLVEQSHRGILFLDEVHRLPPEGQEMLFYLMDRERFRRLGEAKERTASLLLIAATTEDPATALLPTFRRRIPMLIQLPGLHERTIKERYELIRAFFTTECSMIGIDIHVTPQVLQALLLYDCPGNIGQLRTDVQLACAHAYLEYRTNNLDEMHIEIDNLPEHVHHGLLRTAELHRSLEPIQQVLEVTHIFTPGGLNLDNTSDSTQHLYEMISRELKTLRSNGYSEQEISRLLHLDIQHYFHHFAQTLSQGPSETPSQIVDEHIIAVSRSVVQFAEEQLARTFPEKLALVLALHLTSMLEHLSSGHPPTVPALQAMRQTYPIEYEVARMALVQVRSVLGVSLPESEIDLLTVLLANADTLLNTQHSKVGIVVAAHGRGIAEGLTELASTLVGVPLIPAIELSLEQSPDELLTQVTDATQQADQGSGVLLLVDFSSLLSLGELITQRTGIQVRTIAGVSAPLVVEALRRAQQSDDMTVDQLIATLAPFQATRTTTSSLAAEQFKTAKGPLPANQTETMRVILSVCLTGFGSALKLAELIEERLPELREQGVEILCMDINLSGKTAADVQRLVGNRKVVAIVGTIHPHLESYAFISLTEILFGDGIARLHTLLGNTLIDPALLQPPQEGLPSQGVLPERTALIREIAHTLSERMLFLNPTRALQLIENMIEMIEIEVGETFDLEVLAGLLLHLACVLERGMQQRGSLVSEQIHQQVERQFPRELSICRHAWQILSTQVARPLPDEEAYNIVGILRQIDIFTLNTASP